MMVAQTTGSEYAVAPRYPASISELLDEVEVGYDAQEDLFTVRFDSPPAWLKDILAAVFLAGRQAGHDYLPQMVS